MNKYYKVTVERAHQGRGRMASITFYIAAKNALQASSIARNLPGVKHTKSVLSCVSIGMDEYIEGRKVSAYHKFF